MNFNHRFNHLLEIAYINDSDDDEAPSPVTERPKSVSAATAATAEQICREHPTLPVNTEPTIAAMDDMLKKIRQKKETIHTSVEWARRAEEERMKQKGRDAREASVEVGVIGDPMRAFERLHEAEIALLKELVKKLHRSKGERLNALAMGLPDAQAKLDQLTAEIQGHEATLVSCQGMPASDTRFLNIVGDGHTGTLRVTGTTITIPNPRGCEDRPGGANFPEGEVYSQIWSVISDREKKVQKELARCSADGKWWDMDEITEKLKSLTETKARVRGASQNRWESPHRHPSDSALFFRAADQVRIHRHRLKKLLREFSELNVWTSEFDPTMRADFAIQYTQRLVDTATYLLVACERRDCVKPTLISKDAPQYTDAIVRNLGDRLASTPNYHNSRTGDLNVTQFASFLLFRDWMLNPPSSSTTGSNYEMSRENADDVLTWAIRAHVLSVYHGCSMSPTESP